MSGNASASALAGAVRNGERSAVEVVREALATISARNDAINAFTAVTEKRALADAAAVDMARQQGRDPGPLAGVPFAVKNLYDIAGLATIAGSRIDRDRAPTARDAALVRRLTGGGRRRVARSAGARLRHQWVDPRARGTLRRVRAKADPRPAEPLRHAALR